jgi:hypothetical protein
MNIFRDGNLALLGGCNNTGGILYMDCYNVSFISTYNRSNNTWSMSETKTNTKWVPSTLSGSATQVDHDRKLLYLSGGYYYYNSALYSTSSFFMLDLKRNVWIYGAPEENSETQVALSLSSAAVIYNNYFVNLFGNGFTNVNEYTITNFFLSPSNRYEIR